MKYYIKEMRIKSWIKNVFVFIPLVFSGELLNIDKLMMTAIAFAAFCLISSAIYVFNDIKDADKDAMHPVKKTRPIAAGAIKIRSAVIFSFFLALAGLAAGLAVNILTTILITAYLLINIAYTMWLKKKPIFDCFCISAGFVLRVYTGGVASGEPVSDWLFLTVVAMALFMAFGKRHGELVKVGAGSTRDVLQRYDLSFLRGMVFTFAGMAVVFYALWTMYRGSNMIYTVPLILFVMVKYLLIILRSDSHGDPTTVILEDKALLIACGIYGLVTVVLLYAGGKQ